MQEAGCGGGVASGHYVVGDSGPVEYAGAAP
jgi:hypothetical protein